MMFREPTVWERYWAYITVAVAALGLESLLLAALLVNRRKRRRAEHALADQLQFETLLSDVSSRFVEMHPETVPAQIETALACIVEKLGLDRGVVFLLSDDGRRLCANLSSVRSGEAEPPAMIPLGFDTVDVGPTPARGRFSFLLGSRICRLEASRERELVGHLGLKSGAAVALQDNGRVVGMLTFGLRTHEQTWDERILQRLKLFSEVVANALAHARADEALAASRSEARQLAGQLLTAQEDERKRLAREMHDDVSQRLAATAIQAGRIEQQLMADRPLACRAREHQGTPDRTVPRRAPHRRAGCIRQSSTTWAFRMLFVRNASGWQISRSWLCISTAGNCPRDCRRTSRCACIEWPRNRSGTSRNTRTRTGWISCSMRMPSASVWRCVTAVAGLTCPRRAADRVWDWPACGNESGLVGGTMQVESAPQQGTSIVVSIPLPEDAP